MVMDKLLIEWLTPLVTENSVEFGPSENFVQYQSSGIPTWPPVLAVTDAVKKYRESVFYYDRQYYD